MIVPHDSPHEAWRKKQAVLNEKNEDAKARRRQAILDTQGSGIASANRNAPSASGDDPWVAYRERTQNLGKGDTPSASWRGKGKTAGFSAQRPPMHSDHLAKEVNLLKQQLGELTLRADRQDKRIDCIDATLSGNHTEVMSLLHSIAASSSIETGSEGKRPPDTPNTPLKALNDGKERKAAKRWKPFINKARMPNSI